MKNESDCWERFVRFQIVLFFGTFFADRGVWPFLLGNVLALHFYVELKKNLRGVNFYIYKKKTKLNWRMI